MRKLTIALGLLIVLPVLAAADKEVTKAVHELIHKMNNGAKAEEVTALAKKIATGVAEEDVHEVMELLSRPKKGVPGVGDHLKRLQKGVKDADIGKGAKKLKEIGNVLAAVAEISQHTPTKEAKKKGNMKLWLKYAQSMSGDAKKFLAALDAKNKAAVQKSATNLLGACASCHSKFR